MAPSLVLATSYEGHCTLSERQVNFSNLETADFNADFDNRDKT